MTESPFAIVNHKAPIRDVLFKYYPDIVGKGNQFHSPFRPDRTPSFQVYEPSKEHPEDNHCFDFGTWTRYTPTDICRMATGKTILDAAKELNDYFGCGAVFATRKPDKRTVAKAQRKHEAIKEMIDSDENLKILRENGKDEEADKLERTRDVWMLYGFEEDAPEESVRIIEERAVDIFGANAVHDQLVNAGVESVSDVSLLMRKASEFKKIPVRFLWYPLLPVGEYSLMAAPGGTGKGMAAALIAAYVSRGEPLPEDRECPAPLRAIRPDEPHTAIFISSEDTGDVISARLEISGADMERVWVIGKDEVPSLGLNLADPSGMTRLEEIIRSKDAALTIIDPIQRFLEDTDINKMASVRRIMTGISLAAAHTKSAILLIGHTRKGNDGDLNDSVAGSVDIVNAARSVFYITRDYEDGNPDSDNRLIVHSKINSAHTSKTLRFNLTSKEIEREDEETGELATIEVKGGRFAEDDSLFSEVTREVIEAARTMKMTVRRYLQIRDTELSEFEELLESLRLEGERMKRDGVSTWKQHCEKVNGLKKPYPVTISKIAPKLAFDGLSVAFVEQMKLDGVNKSGIVLTIKK